MLCEKCGERAAEVHFMRVVDGSKREVHVCRQCAEQMLPLNEAAKIMRMSFSLEGIMNMEEALKSMLLPMIPEIYELDGRALRCPHCGEPLSAEDLAQMFEHAPKPEAAADEADGPLPGFDAETPQRREAYRERLFEKDAPMGIITPPEKDTQPQDPVQRELAGLKRELELVLRSERYERAAQIRDRIGELEKISAQHE